MKISSEDLLGLPAQTKSGRELGIVVGFELDIDSHSVLNYYVQSHSLIRRLLKLEQDLLISPNRVIAITNESMIVDDNILKGEVEVRESPVIKGTETGPYIASTRK